MANRICRCSVWWSSVTLASALMLAALSAGSGCATYGYAARGPAPDYSQVAIDRMTPRSSCRWSYFWGWKSSLWSPLDCAETDSVTNRCKRVIDPCDGNGAGEVEVSLGWYTVPMAILTLGMAVPSKLTIYCSTQTRPERGP